jgi:type VI secretion system secreted protein VgrG
VTAQQYMSTERDHRIKIQFHWQRGAAPNAGGLTAEGAHPANAPGDDRAGTWVRVAEWLSGPDWGSQFLPRIGTEVLVEFDGGDVDRPVIVGQLHNGEDRPPFSAGADSAANHPGTQSGWHSANHADGYNQWLLDDAPGQVRSRLASSYAVSQLGLGHLVQQSADSAWRGAWRGSGFELRSDAWLAVRAAEGLLVSATARSDAISTQMDAAEAVTQLHAARSTAQTLSDAAAAQGAPALKANADQGRFVATVDPQQDGQYAGAVGGQSSAKPTGQPAERFAQPVILNEGSSDIGLASPAGLLAFAGRSLHATTQQDLHLAAAHTVSVAAGEGAGWFVHAGGVKAVAAAGPFTLQAHTDAMDVLADQAVTVTSSNGEIHVLAKGILTLQAGQSAVTLQGGDVTFACPGSFSVKGSGNAFVGPASGPANLASLPKGTVALPATPANMPVLAEQKFNLQFQALDNRRKPLANSSYFVMGPDGVMQVGKTDSDGKTAQWITKNPAYYSVHITQNDDAVDADEGASA